MYFAWAVFYLLDQNVTLELYVEPVRSMCTNPLYALLNETEVRIMKTWNFQRVPWLSIWLRAFLSEATD